jgi:hypothetical protein
MKPLTLFVAAVALTCPSMYADQITLKNGDRLTGSIAKRRIDRNI